MRDRYHYDKHGNYKGKTSGTPPSEWGGCIACIILLMLAKGCEKPQREDKTESSASGSVRLTQTSSTSQSL